MGLLYQNDAFKSEQRVIMKVKRTSVILSIFSLIVLTLSTVQARVNIVFDLGGVFIDRSYKRICSHVGYKKMANLALRGKNVKKLLYDLLNRITLPGELYEEDYLASDHQGKPCPKALLHWMKGNASGRQIIEAVKRYYDEEADCGLTEETAMKRMVEFIFDPDLFAKTTTVYQKALDFLQECIDEGHNIYILSNLDSGSYEALRAMLPGFFELFDGVVISAHVGLMKPNPAIYTYLLETYNLKPEDTVFIDDQQENLTAAERMGIFPIHCSKTGWWKRSPNFKKVRSSLDGWLAQKEEGPPPVEVFASVL